MTSQTKKEGKFFARGWFMVMIAFVLAIITQGFGLYSFGMIKVNLTQALGESPAAVAGGFSCYTIAISLTGLIVGDIIEKYSLKVSLWISALLYGGAFLLLSQVNAVWQIYVTYIIMGVGSLFGGAVVVTAIASNWFIKHRGLATGIIWSGMLPGSLVSTFIISEVGGAAGWQTAVVALGIIAFVLITVSSFFLKWRPENEGLLPDGETLEGGLVLKAREEAAKERLFGMTRKQAIVTSSFWLIFIAYGINGFAEMGFFQNISAYLVSESLDMTSVAAFMSFLSLAGVIGRLLTGVVVDRIGPKWAYLIINVLGCFGLLCFFFGAVANPIMLYVAGFCFGVNLNSGIICFSNAVARSFGPKYYGQLWGAIFMIKGFGDAVGVPSMAAVAEGAAGWHGVFLMSICGMVVAVILMLLVRKNKRLEELEAQANDKASKTEAKTEVDTTILRGVAE